MKFALTVLFAAALVANSVAVEGGGTLRGGSGSTGQREAQQATIKIYEKADGTEDYIIIGNEEKSHGVSSQKKAAHIPQKTEVASSCYDHERCNDWEVGVPYCHECCHGTHWNNGNTYCNEDYCVTDTDCNDNPNSDDPWCTAHLGAVTYGSAYCCHGYYWNGFNYHCY